MRIRFETTVNDLLAFNRFHFGHSPFMQRQILGFRLIGPLFAIAFGLLAVVTFIAVGQDDPVGFGITAGVAGLIVAAFAIVWFFWAPSYWMGIAMRNVRKIYAEGNNRTMLGWRELDLVNNRLIVKTEFIDSATDLRAIDKIVGNEAYTFVYISSTQAYLIPMNLYPEEEYRQFIEDLLVAWEDREKPRPQESPRPHEVRFVEKPR